MWLEASEHQITHIHITHTNTKLLYLYIRFFIVLVFLIGSHSSWYYPNSSLNACTSRKDAPGPQQAVTGQELLRGMSNCRSITKHAKSTKYLHPGLIYVGTCYDIPYKQPQTRKVFWQLSTYNRKSWCQLALCVQCVVLSEMFFCSKWVF